MWIDYFLNLILNCVSSCMLCCVTYVTFRVAGCPLAAKKRKLLDSSCHEFSVSKTRRSEQKRSATDSPKVTSETEKKSTTATASANNTNGANSSLNQSAASDIKRSEKITSRKSAQETSVPKSNPTTNGGPAGKTQIKDIVDAKEKGHRKTADSTSKGKNIYERLKPFLAGVVFLKHSSKHLIEKLTLYFYFGFFLKK